MEVGWSSGLRLCQLLSGKMSGDILSTHWSHEKKLGDGILCWQLYGNQTAVMLTGSSEW